MTENSAVARTLEGLQHAGVPVDIAFAEWLTACVEDAANRAADQAAEKVMQQLAEQKKSEQKKARDIRLRNTEMLLKNYHLLKEHANQAVSKVADVESGVMEMKAQEIFDLMRQVISRYDIHNASVEQSAAKTYLLMQHVDRMLAAYEVICASEGHKYAERKWRVLHALYIRDPKLSVTEIAEQEFMDPRTVQRDAKTAREEFAVLLFGVDGMQV